MKNYHGLNKHQENLVKKIKCKNNTMYQIKTLQCCLVLIIRLIVLQYEISDINLIKYMRVFRKVRGLPQ